MNAFLLGLATMALSLLALPATAGNITYTNDTGKGTVSSYGLGKNDDYNVAIHLTDKSLVGMTVDKVRLPITATTIKGLKVWLSKELTLATVDGKKQNVPDILTQDVENIAEGFVDVTLAQPYTITNEGVYVGYSFSVNALDDNNRQPLQCTTEAHDGAFYIFTSRTYKKWMDISESAGSLTMQVILGGAKDNAASLYLDEALNGTKGEETQAVLTISNHGGNGVKSFDYTCEVNGQTTTTHVDLGDKALSGLYNVSSEINTVIPAITEKGSFPLTVTVTKVNGEPNEDVSPSTTSTLNVLSRVPKHRPLMEEYTGTWCGNCPRGYIGLMLMNKRYGDDFVGVSYHNADMMEIMPTSSYPSNVEGFPYAYLDRTYGVDPYMGYTLEDVFHLPEVWEAVANLSTPAIVDVSASLSDARDKVSVTSDVMFIKDIADANYEVELMLLADSLHGDGEAWTQTNYFSGSTGTFAEEEWSLFTEGNSKVEGLYYDDVLVATTRTSGKNIALPSAIEEDKTYTVMGEFNLADVLSTSNTQLIQDVKQLRVVAVVIDKTTGAVVNANKGKVTYDPAGIVSVSANASPATKVYDLQGRTLPALGKGVNIVRSSDGHTVKVLKR